MEDVESSSHRLRFDELPSKVVEKLEEALDGHVVSAVNQEGGYSPSLAAACELSDGRSVFVKAVSPAQNPDNPDILRREAAVTAALPDHAPAPRLLAAFDVDDWTVAVYQLIEGRLPRTPWSKDELADVLAATWSLVRIAPPHSIPTITERYGDVLTGWRNLAASAALDDVLDPWSARYLDRLAELEPQWEPAASGNELVHGDVRSDNVLLGPGGVTFVDWSAACRGRTFFDIVAMLPSIALEGGGEPEAVLAGHGGDRIEPDTLTALAIADAGYFLDRARLPDPPGLPTVRAFQKAQGEVGLAWLKRRLRWP